MGRAFTNIIIFAYTIRESMSGEEGWRPSMEQRAQLRGDAVAQYSCPRPNKVNRSVMRLQSIAIGWMLGECAGSIFPEGPAHHDALLGVRLDCMLELCS